MTTVLFFNGHAHDADKVLGKASIAVEPALKEMDLSDALVRLSPYADYTGTKYYDGTPVFINFGGRYIPLLGRGTILKHSGDAPPEKTFKGILITTVALKAARCPEDAIYNRPNGPVTIKPAQEHLRLGEPEQRPPRRYESSQNSYGASRSESATGTSLRSRSPYRGTIKRSGV